MAPRKETLMPLVRIALMKANPDGFGNKIGAVVYRTMTDTINVPAKDNFQLITEHDRDMLIYDPSYLDIPRSDGIIMIQITLNEMIQITLNEGRTIEMKKAFFKTLA